MQYNFLATTRVKGSFVVARRVNTVTKKCSLTAWHALTPSFHSLEHFGVSRAPRTIGVSAVLPSASPLSLVKYCLHLHGVPIRWLQC